MNKTGQHNPAILTEIPIDTQIASTWNSVLDFTAPSTVGMTNEQVASAILKHYWMREIGMETVALWKHKLTTRLEEILPKYVKMFEDIASAGNLLQGVDYTETGNATRTGSENENRTGKVTENGTIKNDITDSNSSTSTTTGTNTESRDSNVDATNQFSDTPQDGLSDVQQGRYLTSANVDTSVENTDISQNSNTKTDGSQTLTRDSDTTSNNVKDSTENSVKTTEDASNNTIRRSGYQGNKVEDVWQYSQKAVSVYQMIIRDVADCFMGILG